MALPARVAFGPFPLALLLSLGFQPATAQHVPAALQGEWGGELSGTYQGEWFDASANYIVVQVIDGTYGEMIMKIGFFPQRQYSCEAQLVLTRVLEYPTTMDAQVIGNGECFPPGLVVSMWDPDNPQIPNRRAISWDSEGYSMSVSLEAR